MKVETDMKILLREASQLVEAHKWTLAKIRLRTLLEIVAEKERKKER